jgi:tRNA modification GTPase
LNELKEKNINKPICISVQENIGIDELKDQIIKLFNSSDLDYSHELIITNERHKDLLKKAVNYLLEAKNEIALGQPIDIVSIYVKKSTKTLGEIIGADVTQDIISKIFEKFCLGK